MRGALRNDRPFCSPSALGPVGARSGRSDRVCWKRDRGAGAAACGRTTREPGGCPDGNHARADGFVSLAVVASALLVALGFERGDPIIGLVITVVILRITWQSWRTVSTTEPAKCTSTSPAMAGVSVKPIRESVCCGGWEWDRPQPGASVVRRAGFTRCLKRSPRRHRCRTGHLLGRRVEQCAEQLLKLDGVLVWVNPIEQGLDRSKLDPMLRRSRGGRLGERPPGRDHEDGNQKGPGRHPRHRAGEPTPASTRQEPNSANSSPTTRAGCSCPQAAAWHGRAGRLEGRARPA